MGIQLSLTFSSICALGFEFCSNCICLGRAGPRLLKGCSGNLSLNHSLWQPDLQPWSCWLQHYRVRSSRIWVVEAQDLHNAFHLRWIKTRLKNRLDRQCTRTTSHTLPELLRVWLGETDQEGHGHIGQLQEAAYKGAQCVILSLRDVDLTLPCPDVPQ